MAGFEHSKGQIVVTLDADLQNPPEEIPRLVRKAEEGFDVVGSVRAYRRDTLFRKMASALVNKLAQKAQTARTHERLRMHVEGLQAPYRRSHASVPREQHVYPGAGQQLREKTSSRSTWITAPGPRANPSTDCGKLINLQFDLMTAINDLSPCVF